MQVHWGEDLKSSLTTTYATESHIAVAVVPSLLRITTAHYLALMALPKQYLVCLRSLCLWSRCVVFNDADRTNDVPNSRDKLPPRFSADHPIGPHQKKHHRCNYFHFRFLVCYLHTGTIDRTGLRAVGRTACTGWLHAMSTRTFVLGTGA